MVTKRQGLLYYSEDAGRSFIELNRFNPSVLGCVPTESVNCSADGQVVYIVDDKGQVYQSTKGGEGLKSFRRLSHLGQKVAKRPRVTPLTQELSPAAHAQR